MLKPLFALGLAITCSTALADPKGDTLALGPDGRCVSGFVSGNGEHAAVLAPKGSKFIVYVDGKPGPVVEQLMNNIQSVYNAPTFWAGAGPMLMSIDGAHCAYIAKEADQYVVYLDQKELCRGPISGGASITTPLTFSMNGSHLFFNDSINNAYHIIADGKPGPDCISPPTLALSPDGNHYAYVGPARGAATPTWSFVDGKQVNYFGGNLEYNGKSVLMSTIAANDAVTMFLNGKPAIKAERLEPKWMTPDGAHIAMVITPSQTAPSFLTVDGKQIAGTEGLHVENVFFSPDNKRYAAQVQTKTGAHFMIIDGKKMQEFQTISGKNQINGNSAHWRLQNGDGNINVNTSDKFEIIPPAFTADSSKFVYVAGTGSQNFIEIEDQESDGFKNMLSVSMSLIGHHIIATGQAPNNDQHVLIDDNDTDIHNDSLVAAAYSSDGSHSAYIRSATLIVDNKPQPNGSGCSQYVFSPDGNHIAYIAVVKNINALLLDGKVVLPLAGNTPRMFFSPDNKHLFWVTQSNIPNTRDSMMLYADGKAITHYMDMFNGIGTQFNFDASGTLTFIVAQDGTPKKFTVTMPDTSIDTLAASAK